MDVNVSRGNRFFYQSPEGERIIKYQLTLFNLESEQQMLSSCKIR
jgi:hypothetical protein